MARPKAGTTLEQRAMDAVVKEADGHWHSTLSPHMPEKGVRFRLRHGRKFVSQLIVLWRDAFGREDGMLSNACGDSLCVNPSHYRDAFDREQQAWKRNDSPWSQVMLDAGVGSEDARHLTCVNMEGQSEEALYQDYGLTSKTECYCGECESCESEWQEACRDSGCDTQDWSEHSVAVGA